MLEQRSHSETRTRLRPWEKVQTVVPGLQDEWEDRQGRQGKIRARDIEIRKTMGALF